MGQTVEVPPLPEAEYILDGTANTDGYTVEQLRERDAWWMARLEEAVRDAERYRWLRDKSPAAWKLEVGDLPLFKGDLDAAIDAAIRHSSSTSGSPEGMK